MLLFVILIDVVFEDDNIQDLGSLPQITNNVGKLQKFTNNQGRMGRL